MRLREGKQEFCEIVLTLTIYTTQSNLFYSLSHFLYFLTLVMTTKLILWPMNRSHKLWCWRKLLRAPWAARRHSLEGPMLKLKLQYLGHVMQRSNSLKTLNLEKTEGRRRRRRQRMKWLDGITDWWTLTRANSGRWWRTGRPGVLQSMGSQRVRQDWATVQQQ